MSITGAIVALLICALAAPSLTIVAIAAGLGFILGMAARH